MVVKEELSEKRLPAGNVTLFCPGFSYGNLISRVESYGSETR